MSGKNLYKLLRAGETVLLFPGGVREAYKKKGEKYRLFWPSRPEFVRMAVRFGATVVPFSAVCCVPPRAPLTAALRCAAL